jgi:hypothetical protein
MRFFKKNSPEEKFWEWFVSYENELFDLERNQENVFSQLQKALSEVNPDLTFEFGPIENGVRDFVISADGLKAAFPAVEKLYSCAPYSNKWRFIKFRPRRMPATVQIGTLTLESIDLNVVLEKDGQKIGLTIFGKGYKGNDDKQFQQAAFIMLDGILGEFDMETKVGFIEFRCFETPSALTKVTLEQLPEVFDNFIKGLSN